MRQIQYVNIRKTAEPKDTRCLVFYLSIWIATYNCSYLLFCVAAYDPKGLPKKLCEANWAESSATLSKQELVFYKLSHLQASAKPKAYRGI